MTNLKFMYNGIKKDGKLIKGHWSKGGNIKGKEVITFYCRSYENCNLNQYFDVKNGSEIETDYFEKDHFDIDKSNKYYGDSLLAYCKQEIKHNNKIIKSLENRKKLYTSNRPYDVEMREYYNKEIKRQNNHIDNCSKIIKNML